MMAKKKEKKSSKSEEVAVATAESHPAVEDNTEEKGNVAMGGSLSGKLDCCD